MSVPRGVRDLASGNPDPCLLPDLAPTLRRLKPGRRLYGADPAVPELLELARKEFASEGIEAVDLVVVSGALDGVERVLTAHLRPGDAVAVEDPGYPGVLDLCRALGLILSPVAIDAEGMLPPSLRGALASGARAVVVTPRGQNPTGASLSAERARSLRDEFERAPDVLVVEDDHLGSVGDSPRRTLVGARDRWAAVRSLAKSFGPDLRVAILTGDANTVDHVSGRLLLGPQWVSHILQQLAVALWTDGKVGARLTRARELYRARRQHFVDRLAELGIFASAPSGLNVWIPVSDEASVVSELVQRGWAVAGGGPFRLRAEPAIRITTSTLEARDAERLAVDIAGTLAPVRRTRAA
jgi:DNA-binding transcriptional MocR family regulator